jgi:hypothetical protein
MTSLELAKGVYQRTAEENEGQTARTLARELQDQAREIRVLQEQTAANVERTMDTPSPEVTKDTQEISEETRDAITDVIRQDPSAADEDMEEVADHLEEAGKDLEEAFAETNATNENLGEGVAGQAMLNQKGSETFDATKMEGEEAVVDADMAEGVAKHEAFHAEQKAADTQSVVLANGQKVTALEFEEAGAMEAQGGKGTEQLSTEYKEIRRKFEGLLPPAKLKELSKEGKLKEYAMQTYAVAA